MVVVVITGYMRNDSTAALLREIALGNMAVLFCC